MPLIIMRNRSRRAASGSTVINDLFNFPAHHPNYAGPLRGGPAFPGEAGRSGQCPERGREEGSGETLSCFPKTVGLGAGFGGAADPIRELGRTWGLGKDSAHLWREW